MAFDPKQAAQTGFGDAIGQALRSTFGNLIPFGLVLLGLSLIPFGGLLVTPLIAVAAVLGLREGRRLSIGEIFNGFGSRFVAFLLTFLATLLFGFLLALPIIVIAMIAVFGSLGAGFMSPDSVAGLAMGTFMIDADTLTSLAQAMGVAFLIALVLLIPILYLSLRLSLAFQTVVDGASGFGAFRRSWALTKGSVWRAFGWYFGAALIAFVVTLPIALIGIALTLIASMADPMAVDAAGGLAGGLLMSLLGTIGTVLSLMIGEWMHGVFYLRQVAVHGSTQAVEPIVND